jgi:predicted O-methyltransferase YrrM
MIPELNDLRPKSIIDELGRDFFAADLGRPEHDEYLLSGNYYEWYCALARHYRPQSVLEIGVRLGYSLASMAHGTSDETELFGIDIDAYVPGSLSIARAKLAQRWPRRKLDLQLINSQRVRSFPRAFDLVHIDGDHSYSGKLHDLTLTLGSCKVVIVDDFNSLHQVRAAAIRFLDDHQARIARHYVIPSVRGTLVIEFAS